VLLIKNGRVHDGNLNVFERMDILVKNGIISRMEEDISCETADIIDAAGKEIFPGFVEPLNTWGVTGPAWTGHDSDEASDPLTPEMNIVDGFDHDGMLFQKVFTYGITSAGITPCLTNVLSGSAAAFKTVGRSPYDMLIRENIAMIGSVSNGVKQKFRPRNIAPQTRMGAFALLKKQLKAAVDYDAKKGYDAKCKALQPVLSGEMPLFVNCANKAQIDALMMALKEYPDVRLVILGAYGMDRSFEQITSGRCGVITGDISQAFNDGGRILDYEAVIGMINAGARVAIGCCGEMFGSGRESLLFNAAMFRKRGLGTEQTLRAITLTPAELLGIDKRVGSIAQGKDADIVIWSANPLETYLARAETVLIDGKDVLKGGGHTSCW
jgi:imidazolonepropionase-like amidohydrolase